MSGAAARAGRVFVRHRPFAARDDRAREHYVVDGSRMPKNWEEAEAWVAGGTVEPLTVICPRCARLGVASGDGRGEYVIEWRDEARGWSWCDDGVTPQELASPEFGCGHDRLTAHGFVGGSPLLRVPK